MGEAIYRGERGDEELDEVNVTVMRGDNVRPLAPRLDLRRHSPTGFEWGYGGSGPAQLALAILADHTTEEEALALYQDFKFRVIGALPRELDWVLTSADVEKHLVALRAAAAERASKQPA